ncbi:MAG: 23S rRNA (cytidine(2498)-2'-O)-methyltransferase RlmM [Gammaproteobacteria bacterium]|nr:MAG: 23S rRNA (cytidine(2498)-2'-O)-methyltransferase RlmM [Gammaproteobacteria bacterium]
MNYLFLHCRIGFEKECAAEMTYLASEAGIYGYSKTKDNSAYVIFITHEVDGAFQLQKKISFSKLIFTRQWFVTQAPITDLPVNDRVTPLLDIAQNFPVARELVIETIDTNEGKELSTLSKKFTAPFSTALRKCQRLENRSSWRLHLVFVTGTEAYLGVSLYDNSSQWPTGIARLRLPKEAPSRATLKLEEAWHHFIPAADWDTRLGPGMRAVDLGAAPGGWTWQLVQRGMYVEAVDNGPMDKNLLETGQVIHILTDGFLYEPKKKVDWLVCDIVDKPARVSSMIIQWFAKGHCREAIFNLKLPMKQRYLEVKKCEQRILKELRSAGLNVGIQFKQLYHDREEVTGHLRVFK